MAVVRDEDNQRVTELELFFDLVFVFAITQVTALMSHEPTWEGLGKGMLVLSALWFAWAAFAWLTTSIDPDEGGARAVMFVTMGGLLIASLAVPHAFDEDAAIFGAAYLLVRAMQIVAYALGDASVGNIIRTLGPSMVGTGLLILAAGLVEGTLRYVLWIAAIAVNVIGPYVSDRSSWRIHAEHFAERHGLFIIIALGESIVAAGVGIADQELDAQLVAAATLALVIAAGQWWTYFDIGIRVGTRALERAEGDAQGRLARDAWTFIHWPMVAGIILFALGVKKALGHVDEPLEVVPAVALCGGSALYVFGQVLFRIRNVGQLSRRRSVLMVALLVLIPVAHEVDALIALTLVALAWWVMITYELLRYGDARHRMRHTQEMPAR